MRRDCFEDAEEAPTPAQLSTTRTAMAGKPKQAKVFRVHCRRTEDSLAAEDFFVELSNAEHPIKRKNRGNLRLKHVFSRIGSNTFLINLLDKTKATPKFVETVVEAAFGPHCSVECVNRSRHDCFLPVERKAKETKLSNIECEAAAMAGGGGDCSARFILVDATHKVVYSYNDQGRLTSGKPEPRGAHAEVGSDAAQVRSTSTYVDVLHVVYFSPLLLPVCVFFFWSKTSRSLQQQRLHRRHALSAA